MRTDPGHGAAVSFDSLLIVEPTKARSAPFAYFSTPPPDVAQDRGVLFVVGEFRSPIPNAEDIASSLRDVVEDSFYASEDDALDTAFESALQRANEQLHRRIAESSSNWLKHFNAIVGVIGHGQLHLTSVGSMHALLVHGTRVVDIVDSLNAEETAVNKLKVFTNILTGELSDQDRLLITTPALFDYLSQEKIRRIMHDASPASAVEQLEELLEGADASHAFSAVVAHLRAPVQQAVRAQEHVREPGSAGDPQASMQSLQNREERTSELLTPSLLRSTKQSLQSLWQRATSRARSREKLPPEKPATNETDPAAEQPNTLPLKQEARPQASTRETMTSISQGLQTVGKKVAGAAKNAVGTMRRSHPRDLRPIDRLSNGLTNAIVRFRKLPGLQQLLLVAALVLLFFFTQNVVNIGSRQEAQQIVAEYEQRLREVEEKIRGIDAALIYEDFENARQLRSEAEELIASLPDDYAEQKERFQADLRAQENEVNLITEVREPELVVDFGNGFSEGVVGPRQLTMVDGVFFGMDGNANTVYRYAPGQSPERSSADLAASLEISSFQLAAPFTGGIGYVHLDGLVEFDPDTNNVLAADLAFFNEDREIVDLAYYLNRVYMLDRKNNQVIRHDRSAGAVYSSGSAWITGDVDIRDAVSVAVDGNVWVLKGNGELVKLFGGERESGFAIAPFEPQLNNPTQLVKTTDTSNMYILDASEKRLVILAEDGSLIRQYRSERFDNLKDLVVDEAEDVAYVLNGTRVYRIPFAEGE